MNDRQDNPKGLFCLFYVIRIHISENIFTKDILDLYSCQDL